MSPAKVLPSPSPSANYFGVTACGDTTHIFNTCVMDLLFAPSGVTYPSIEDFCKPLSFQGDWKWYSCLCSKTQTLNLCYSTNCPGDESYSTALKTQDQYCASAAQYAPTNTTASTAWWTSTEGPTLAIPTEINAVTSKVGENAIKSGADVSVFDAVVAFAVLVGIF
ncbi:hypothetical protein BC830DRAFT_1163425 [Chytriomyces sp. MP71]|nr:hypothetical protein BC830DRAFT_1163425 [Chytriomyces sp. MP71]